MEATCVAGEESFLQIIWRDEMPIRDIRKRGGAGVTRVGTGSLQYVFVLTKLSCNQRWLPSLMKLPSPDLMTLRSWEFSSNIWVSSSLKFIQIIIVCMVKCPHKLEKWNLPPICVNLNNRLISSQEIATEITLLIVMATPSVKGKKLTGDKFLEIFFCRAIV